MNAESSREVRHVMRSIVVCAAILCLAMSLQAQQPDQKPILVLDPEGHTDGTPGAVFTPDGQRVLTGSKDITAKLCDPNTGKEILTLTGHTQEITCVAVSPDGSSLLTGSRDGTAIVWLTVPWREAPPLAMSQARPAQ